ncbi:MAG: pyridoxal 5'-phosphate synthase glutaminase subunit PdxT [Armatimonadetes bacterium]|nr:pyridoxal 5'-phosphate synthase glutaminase subunit PdxT [Armatimonadota bacterium]
MPSDLTIGVLALQGAFQKHIEALQNCGAEAIAVRTAQELARVSGLIIPGGESTTVGKLMARYGLDAKITEAAHQGMPIYGTCMGLIVMARDIVGSDQPRLGLMDVTVLRNAFGRQVDSFEADLDISEIGPPPVRAVFIRAPYIVHAGADVRVLATCDDKIVLVRQGNLLGGAFHPELTGDARLHGYFIGMVEESLAVQSISKSSDCKQ